MIFSKSQYLFQVIAEIDKKKVLDQSGVRISGGGIEYSPEYNNIRNTSAVRWILATGSLDRSLQDQIV